MGGSGVWHLGANYLNESLDLVKADQGLGKVSTDQGYKAEQSL